MKSILRTLFVLLGIGIFNITFLCLETRCQEKSGITVMNKSDQIKAAMVLKALKEKWLLVDESSDIDFLIGVNEDRDELDFYPKKELVKKIEALGLIENLDKEGSAVREPDTYYKGDYLKGEWKEITEASSIVYQYQITDRGHKFLRDAPKLLGKPLPPLKIAKTTFDVERKPLKTVIYDRQTIQNLVDAFIQKSKTQVETAFSNRSDSNLSSFSPRGLMCGPKLWQMLKPEPLQNGVQYELRIEKRTYDGSGNVKITQIDDHPVPSGDETNLFWKRLQENFITTAPLTIEQAEPSQAAAYLKQLEIQDSEFPSPNLSFKAAVFIVESSKFKFIVVNKSEFDAVLKRFEPAISWIELIENSEK